MTVPPLQVVLEDGSLAFLASDSNTQARFRTTFELPAPMVAYFVAGKRFEFSKPIPFKIGDVLKLKRYFQAVAEIEGIMSCGGQKA